MSGAKDSAISQAFSLLSWKAEISLRREEGGKQEIALFLATTDDPGKVAPTPPLIWGSRENPCI